MSNVQNQLNWKTFLSIYLFQPEAIFQLVTFSTIVAAVFLTLHFVVGRKVPCSASTFLFYIRRDANNGSSICVDDKRIISDDERAGASATFTHFLLTLVHWRLENLQPQRLLNLEIQKRKTSTSRTSFLLATAF